MRSTMRWRWALWAAITLALGSVIDAPAQATAPDGNSCTADEPEPRAGLSWQEVPTPDAFAETRGKVHLVAQNLSDVPLDLAIDLVRDRGGVSKRSRPKRRRLSPRASATVEIDLGKLQIPAGGMEFSGQLLASASVIEAGTCSGENCPLPSNPFDDGDDAERLPEANRPGRQSPPIDHIAAPPLHFHARPGRRFAVYGAEVLATRFRGGDLRGKTSPPRGVAVQRVTDGGRGIGEHPQLEREMNIPVHGGIGVSPFPPVPPGSARVCIKWEIGLTDHGRVVTSGGVNVTEDYWHGYSPEILTDGFTGFALDVPSGGGGGGGGSMIGNVAPGSGNMIVTARGVNIAVRRGSYLEFFDTNPASGCVTFPLPAGEGPFAITVNAAHRDAHGNRIRFVNGVGSTFAFTEIVGLPKGKTTNVAIGSFTPRATLAAITGFALYRTALGLENKTIEVIENGSCGWSSAHVEFSGLPEGSAQMQIYDGTDSDPECKSSDHRRRKFLVTHELGHALALLAFAIEDEEPGIDYDFADPDETACSIDGLYSIGSVEWSSTTAREGFAHFYGTRVFNSPASGNGVFTWLAGDARDVERHNPHAKGGRLYNTCDGTIKEGVGTNLDWLRFYWDMHTPLADGGPTDGELLGVYRDAVLGGNLTRANYLSEFRVSIGNVIPAARRAATVDRLNDFACWNGLETGGFCAADFTYPDCEAASPDQGAGFPGCPCADLEPLGDESDLLVDGHYADGSGSYLEKGAGGPQYCVDQPNGLTEQAVCGIRPHVGGDVGICELCGVDTMWGCACATDAECTGPGLDGVTLACLGSPESGFGGDRPGICLPSPDTPGGRGHLVDQPWFCLDNCGAKGSFDGQYACLFDQQLPNGPQPPHGECADVAFCSTIETGFCEAAGLFCDPDATCASDDADCCTPECSEKSDCGLLRFPDHYECDEGRCVPPECAGEKVVDLQYCALYR